MYIMIVGVCDVPHSTNTFMAKALETLGHKVLRYNYLNYLKELVSQDRVEEHFIDKVKEEKPDLVIFCKTDMLPVSAHERATKLTKTHYWFMDPITTSNVMGAPDRAQACTSASATAMEVVNQFKENNQPNSFKIIEGVDTSLYYPISVEKSTDVLFAGSITQDRAVCVNFLRSNGVSVNLFGEGWPPVYKAGRPIYNEDLVNEIRKAKIVLNVTRTNSYSDRVALSMAAGSMVITTEISEIHRDFDVDNHLITYSGVHELVAKVLYYLYSVDKREAIARYGCEFVQENFTWEKKCYQLLRGISCI